MPTLAHDNQSWRFAANPTCERALEEAVIKRDGITRLQGASRLRGDVDSAPACRSPFLARALIRAFSAIRLRLVDKGSSNVIRLHSLRTAQKRGGLGRDQGESDKRDHCLIIAQPGTG